MQNFLLFHQIQAAHLINFGDAWKHQHMAALNFHHGVMCSRSICTTTHQFSSSKSGCMYVCRLLVRCFSLSEWQISRMEMFEKLRIISPKTIRAEVLPQIVISPWGWIGVHSNLILLWCFKDFYTTAYPTYTSSSVIRTPGSSLGYC